MVFLKPFPFKINSLLQKDRNQKDSFKSYFSSFKLPQSIAPRCLRLLARHEHTSTQGQEDPPCLTCWRSEFFIFISRGESTTITEIPYFEITNLLKILKRTIQRKATLFFNHFVSFNISILCAFI